MKEPRTPKLVVYFLIFTVVLDSIGFGIIAPVMPLLIEEISGQVGGDAALWNGRILLAFGLTQFLFSPLIGRLSDSYGRRPVLLIAISGEILVYIILALSPNLIWLFIGRMLAGLATATRATANAVVADVSEGDQRTKYFGLLGAAFGIGFVIGPGLGGLLAEFGTRAPFWGAAFIAFVNLIFGLLVFHETLPAEKRRAFQLRDANPFKSFALAWQVKALLPFLAIWFLVNSGFVTWSSVYPFFVQLEFGKGAFFIGATMSIFGLVLTFAQGFGVRFLVDRFRTRQIVVGGLMLQSLTFLLTSFAGSAGWMFVLFPLAALATVANPAFNNLITRLVPGGDQGQLQGLLASVNALAFTFAPLIMTNIFAYFTDVDAGRDFAGAPFALAAVLLAVAAALFAYATRIIPPADAPPVIVENTAIENPQRLG